MAEERIKITPIIDSGDSKKTLKDLRNEVKGYKDDLTNLDRGTKEYNDTVTALAQVQGQINSINRDVRNSTLNLTDVYREVSSVSAGVVAGFNSVKAISTLVGAENEALTETFVKLQAGMALVQSLTALSNGFKSLTAILPKARLAAEAFNTTLRANPIIAVATVVVVLTTALAGLIAKFGDLEVVFEPISDAFNELKELIVELFPVLKDAGGLFETFGRYASAAGRAITSSFIAPLKAAIKVIKFDFKGALNELSEGANLIKNFNEGLVKFDDNAAENKAKKEKESTIKSIKNNIEENEAKYGSNFKYTKDGIELYRDYYDKQLELYKDDEEKFRQIQNQKFDFERQLLERSQNANKSYNDKAKSEREAAAREIADAIKEIETDLAEEIERIRVNALTNKELKAELSNQEAYLKDLEEIARDTNRSDAERAATWKLLVKERERFNNLSQVDKERDDEAERKLIVQKEINDLTEKYNSLLENGNTQLEFNKLGLEEQLDFLKQQDEELINQNNNRINEINTLLESEILVEEQRKELLQERIDLLQEVYDAEVRYSNNSIKLDKAQTDNKRKESELQQKLLDARLRATSSFLSSSSRLFKENSAEAKALNIARATIDTYAAANATLRAYAGIPGPTKYIELAAVITSGLANVKAIINTNENGSKSAIDAGVNTGVPTMPNVISPIQETHNNLDAYDEDFFNQSQRVYVVESDITEVQNRVRVTENESSF